MSHLNFTGERFVPGVFGKIEAEHIHRYAFALGFIKGQKVLDIASGEGYGSNLLANDAQHVTGVDISTEAIFHSRAVYEKRNLTFQVGSVLEIPCESESFDVVVSFETLEHISDHQKMILEIRRVLKPNGKLIISTPEKAVYSDQQDYINPFHVKELYEEEFIGLISQEFKYYQLAYQKFFSGSLIQPIQSNREKLEFFEGNYQKIEKVVELEREYLIAVCSNEDLENYISTTFLKSSDLEKDFLEQIVANRIKKLKSGLRYRLIDFLFKPWDQLKKMRK